MKVKASLLFYKTTLQQITTHFNYSIKPHTMHTYSKYFIKTTDQFDPEYFSSINEEVASINTKVEHLPVSFKPDIIVSFLKDHSLQNDWIKANPGLTELVTSGLLFTGNIESLFESCRNNPVFRKDLEIYLTKRFSEPASYQTKQI